MDDETRIKIANRAREIGLTCSECGRSHLSAHAPNCRRPNGLEQWVSHTTKQQLAEFERFKADLGWRDGD